MDGRPTSLKERIRSEAPLLGMSLGSLSPAVVEVAGLCGCDFVWIDVEHGCVDLMHAEHLCRAAELHGVLPLFRIQDGTRAAVLRALETGAKIVVVPQIHTPEEAAALVKYGKFPPVGNRGFNTGTRGLGYGFGGVTPQEVFAKANAGTCLLAQIESQQAVDNAEAIIATEGLDGILVGPGDLSASMGLMGQWENEQLISTVERILRLANDHGKIAATVVLANALIPRLKAAGAHMLNVAGDLGLIRAALSARLAEIRAL